MTESIPSGALKVADPRIAHVLDYLDWRARQAQPEGRLTLQGYAEAIRELAALASCPPQPTMADALAAGDGTLHGAIDYWQQRALAAEAKATVALSEPIEEQDPELLQAMVEANKWHFVDDIVPILKASRAGDWQWFANTRCKYIELRIDMRDLGCIIKDRDRVRITPATLGYQFGAASENKNHD